MKITLVFVSVFIATMANAQFSIGTAKVGPKVTTYADNEYPTQISVDGMLQATLAPGKPWFHDYAARLHTDPMTIIVAAQVCTGGLGEPILQDPPPPWSSDTRLGGLTITPQFLENADESLLNKRVKDIQDLLKLNRDLGRKERIAELKQWATGIKKHGVRIVPTCQDPIRTNGVPIKIWGDYYDYGNVLQYPYNYDFNKAIFLQVRGVRLTAEVQKITRTQ